MRTESAVEMLNLTPRRAALMFGLIGAVIAYVNMHAGKLSDFLYWWSAARAVLAGQSPYAVIPSTDPRLVDGFFYPLPAALLTIPVAWLPYPIAGTVFTALSSAVLAYALASRVGPTALWFFGSAPFVLAANQGGWTLLLLAAALLPALGPLVVVKPNVGVGTFLYRPTWWMVIGALALIVVSFAVQPTWLSGWLADLRGPHGVRSRVVPMLTPSGPLLLLALTRWRRPEARLLVGYACVPQAPWLYDVAILWLVTGTTLERMNYALLTNLTLVAWLAFRGPDPSGGNAWLAAAEYLPLLVMVLRRPNEGEVPAWVDRIARSLHSLLRARSP